MAYRDERGAAITAADRSAIETELRANCELLKRVVAPAPHGA